MGERLLFCYDGDNEAHVCVFRPRCCWVIIMLLGQVEENGILLHARDALSCPMHCRNDGESREEKTRQPVIELSSLSRGRGPMGTISR